MNTSKLFFALTLFALVGFGWNQFSKLEAAENSGKFSDTEKKEIEQIIHDYLIENPEVLLKASQELQRKSMESQMEASQNAVNANKEKLLASHSAEMGNPDGNIVIVEFLDYQCHHCKTMAPVMKSLIDENSNLRVSLMPIPILGEGSVIGTKAAFAAVKQGKFPEFHEALLAESGKLSEEKVQEIAKKSGLDVEKLKEDMEDPSIMTQIQETFNLARSLGVQATPFMVVMGDPSKGGSDSAIIVPGAVPEERLQALIDQAKGNQK